MPNHIGINSNINFNIFWIMTQRKSWQEFRESGLFLLLNQFLHIFGWAIVLNIEFGEVTECYPARVKFRGFDEKSTSEAYERVSKYMKDNGQNLYDEIAP